MNGKQAKRIRKAIGFYPNKQRHYVEKFVFFKPIHSLTPKGEKVQTGEYRTNTIMNPIRSVRFLYRMLKKNYTKQRTLLLPSPLKAVTLVEFQKGTYNRASTA